ncbi:hypothetical protein D5086_012977 [Populus alba]|uniref:Uncharacterized protein n=1 Tax=Populus alba TaxID=43335 RepID=A0ACC4C462_POPAL
MAFSELVPMPVLSGTTDRERNMEMSWGSYGASREKSYVQLVAQMAVASKTWVPWIMCQQRDAPSSVYHGGTNFGRTSGGPFIATSYDYEHHLDEYVFFKIVTRKLYNTERKLHEMIHLKALLEWAPEPTKPPFTDKVLIDFFLFAIWSLQLLWGMTPRKYFTVRLSFSTISCYAIQRDNNGHTSKNVTLRVKYSGQFLQSLTVNREGDRYPNMVTLHMSRSPALLKAHGTNMYFLLLSATQLLSSVSNGILVNDHCFKLLSSSRNHLPGSIKERNLGGGLARYGARVDAVGEWEVVIGRASGHLLTAEFQRDGDGQMLIPWTI